MISKKKKYYDDGKLSSINNINLTQDFEYYFFPWIDVSGVRFD